MYVLPKTDKPAWAGPLHGGITQSLINKFLDCPYRFYLYSVLGKEDPGNINDNLIWGQICHKGLEHIIEHPNLVSDFTKADKDDLLNLLQEYTSKNYPSAGASFPYSATEMCMLYDDSYKQTDNFKAEVKFEIPYTTDKGNRVTLRGKVDGLGVAKMAEHKCVGFTDPNQARLETPSDLQLNLYMMVTGVRECIYDKIKIPDTNKYAPQRRQMERPSHWVKRLYHDHVWKEYPISKNKYIWLDQFTVFRDDEEIERFRAFQLNPLIDIICAYWEKVTDPNFDPNNPAHYDHLFYIKPIRTFDASRTEKYKCNYYQFLTEQMDFEQLVDTHFYAELDDDA